MVAINVRRIAWDDYGHTISVAGLRPVLLWTDGHRSAEIKITAAPKVVDGFICLKLAGKGDKEYKLKASFGRGKTILPDWDVTN